MNSRPIQIEVSAGELIDKITILRIKSGRFSDPQKLRSVQTELAALENTLESQELTVPSALFAELQATNEKLWEIEDQIRVCERNEDFGERFVELARAVYRTNDERSRLKAEINRECRSRLHEEKDYADY